ncbi:hypothetical protein [Haloplanus halophilus]|uniref:hypothetical protein n=1 Tax=Haloplanus halophilus TaxID=2949993 RepID=UPI002041EA7C|nr:hypothetical protein [Haloplanus sp. GDY1]
MTDRRSLSRRHLLWGLTTIGAAATTGSGTAALLSDSARTDARMTAGALDLSASWGNDDSITVESSADDGGERRITLTVDDNPAYLCFRTDCPDTPTDPPRNDRGWTDDDWMERGTARRTAKRRNGTARNATGADGRDGGDPRSSLQPSTDRGNGRRNRTGGNDRVRDTTLADRLLVRYGIDRHDGSGVEWLSGYLSLREARTTYGTGACIDGEIGPDDTWEFVVQWKTDEVVTNSTDVEFDFEFYASQSRHVDPDSVDPDWECGPTGTQSGISWVTLCSTSPFDPEAANVDPTLSDDGLTVSFSNLPDAVTTVVIKYGRKLDVVDSPTGTSITVGDDGATTYDQATAGFTGTDRTNPQPCPAAFGCKYEFPGWECKPGTDGSTDDSVPADSDGERRGGGD